MPGDGQVVQIAGDERGGAVEIRGQSLQGDPVDLADLRGEVVVLNVWGSWCNPCRDEAPELVEAAAELDGTASFVGLFARSDNTADAQAFEREYDIPYPTIDDDGEALLQLGERAPRAVPSTVVLDERGRVAVIISGAIPSAGTLVDVVEDVAGEGA